MKKNSFLCVLLFFPKLQYIDEPTTLAGNFVLLNLPVQMLLTPRNSHIDPSKETVLNQCWHPMTQASWHTTKSKCILVGFSCPSKTPYCLVYTTDIHFLPALDSGNLLSGKQCGWVLTGALFWVTDNYLLTVSPWMAERALRCLSLIFFLSFAVLGIGSGKLIWDGKPTIRVTKVMNFK